MARAQTYIINKKDKVYNHISDYHSNNYETHFKLNYNNLQITDYIPYILMRDDNCIIDIVRHSTIGAIYLPQDLTEFQKNWLLAREWSLKKRIWHLCTMREYGIENYNDVDFKTVKKEIKRKRLKRN